VQDPIPRVAYTQKEIETWGYIYDKLEYYIENKFLRRYKENFDKLKKKCGMSRNHIP
jgi:hypothetical protein